MSSYENESIFQVLFVTLILAAAAPSWLGAGLR
jgi:hypothetical protein